MWHAGIHDGVEKVKETSCDVEVESQHLKRID